MFEVTYFVYPIPGANRFATSLRSCKNIPDVFVMSMDGRYAANAGAIGGHFVQVGHGLNVQIIKKATLIKLGLFSDLL